MLIIFIGKKKEKTAKGKPKKNLKIGMAVAVLWVQDTTHNRAREQGKPHHQDRQTESMTRGEGEGGGG